jgi:hypothetical protein
VCASLLRRNQSLQLLSCSSATESDAANLAGVILCKIGVQRAGCNMRWVVCVTPCRYPRRRCVPPRGPRRLPRPPRLLLPRQSKLAFGCSGMAITLANRQRCRWQCVQRCAGCSLGLWSRAGRVGRRVCGQYNDLWASLVAVSWHNLCPWSSLVVMCGVHSSPDATEPSGMQAVLMGC